MTHFPANMVALRSARCARVLVARACAQCVWARGRSLAARGGERAGKTALAGGSDLWCRWYAQWDERIRLQELAATLPPVPTSGTTTRTFIDPLLVTLQENYEKASSTDSDAGTGESYGEATFTDGDDDDDLSYQLHLFVAR